MATKRPMRGPSTFGKLVSVHHLISASDEPRCTFLTPAIVYPPAPNSPLHIALTDTLTTADFFRAAFTPSRARAWRGLRQDSGDPITYAKEAKRVYGELGVSMEAKVIVFSDALDVERCLDIQKFCDGEAIGCSFGVGTFLTNGASSRLLSMAV